MNILIAHHAKIPVKTYGGTERIVWWLGKVLHKKGHQVTYLVPPGSACNFAKVIHLDKTQPIDQQIPSDTDMVHFFFQPNRPITKPYLVTNQGNVPRHEKEQPLDQNTVFVSKNHAERHQATCFVHNGIDPEDYGKPDMNNKRNYFHFLAKASWKVKNLKGAIDIARQAGYPLHVMGGNRINFKMGFRFTPSLNVKFHGMVGSQKKNTVLSASKGLLFPVLWHEPFGIAMIESLYFGCPVYGTPYGSLPEVVTPSTGFLSSSTTELIAAIKSSQLNAKTCHEHVLENFTTETMTNNYLRLYEKVLNGNTLNGAAPSAIQTKNEQFPASLAP